MQKWIITEDGDTPCLNLHNVVGHKHRKSCFADKDSDNENFDCGSDVEFVPDSEYDSACEESDLDESRVMPHSSFSQDVENVSRNLPGNYFCIWKL